MVRTVLIASILSLSVLLAAGAAQADHRPPCAEVTDGLIATEARGGAAVPYPSTSSIPLLVYVYHRPGDFEFWQEGNGYGGLQRIGCIDESGQYVGKDDRIADVT